MPACRRVPSLLLLSLLFALAPGRAAANSAGMTSVFFPEKVVAALRQNLASNPAARVQAAQTLADAAVWLRQSDEELWSAMFGATLTRSWMVRSNGFCPSCRRDVPMYSWKIDPHQHPWKVACPHCQELFPQNDFAAFYRSGLDVHGVFDPARADRSLLFNARHPGIDDPLRNFGVDDGTGYSDGERRWHFVGAYLIYGQWKKHVLRGIHTLSMAYVLTGDKTCAHKAAVLLDRVADLYPTFDFLQQGLSYERADPIIGAGVVSVWHDACRESLDLALAYDMIAPAIAEDAELVRFLSAQAARHRLANPKDSPAAIRRNIEDGILRHVLARPDKILSNFPHSEITRLVSLAILGWPGNRAEIMGELRAMLDRATAVDGLTGEKGLASYSSGGPRSISSLLSLFSRLDPQLIATLVHDVPGLQRTYRFHVDTWIAERLYPKVADTGAFGRGERVYAGALFNKNPFGPTPGALPFTSDFSVFGELYRITRDPFYIQVLYHANGHRLEGLPYDPLVTDPAPFQAEVAAVIHERGPEIATASVNKEQWSLAILRAGQGDHARAVWLDYDVGGNHGRPDAMNLGFFAKGFELLPGFGYPPVQYGGWYSPRAQWYKMTASHNTVVVDGQDQVAITAGPETEPLAIQLNPTKGLLRGTTTAWAPGQHVQLVRADAAKVVRTADLERYERSLLLVDISAEDSYLLDIFRVAGGRDHAKFLHAFCSTAHVTGLDLQPQPDFGHGTQMRHFRGGEARAGWQVDFALEDRFGARAKGQPPVHLRYTDLTDHAQAALAESWVAYQEGPVNHEVWLPSLLVRRQAPAAPLASTFVAVLEPYEGQTNVRTIIRLPLRRADGSVATDTEVAVAVELKSGARDLLIAASGDSTRTALTQPDHGCTTDAAFAFIRRDASGRIAHVFIYGGTFVQCGDQRFEHAPGAVWTEL